MLSEMVSIAVECIKNPAPQVVWSPEANAYVCPDDVAAHKGSLDFNSQTRPPISASFKLVFVTAAIGTVFFFVVCILLTITAGIDPHPLTEMLVKGLFDLVKVGFGAIVGLLGAKQLE